MKLQLKGINAHYTTLPQPTGDKIGIYGDSISVGAGASNNNNAYYSIYEDITGLQIHTMSQYSRTVQEGLQQFNLTNSLENLIFNPTSDQLLYSPVLTYSGNTNYKYLFFRLGVNDILQKVGTISTKDTFKETYKECLNEFLLKGWPRNRIKLINIGSYLGNIGEIQQALITYNQAVFEIGNEMGFQVVDLHTLDTQNNPSSLYADDVHPNDLGHFLHGSYIASLIN